jgi:hypothetical protein
MQPAPTPEHYFGRSTHPPPLIPDLPVGLDHERQHLYAEFRALHTIISDSANCTQLSKSEASWNSDVHRPLLAMAVDHSTSVSQENMCVAYPLALRRDVDADS